MYFFYADESGTMDPATSGVRADGSKFKKDHIYVLSALSLFESRWHGFEKTLNRKKMELVDIHRKTNRGVPRLDLADCEIKSTWIRVPSERRQRPFLDNLTPDELTKLVDLYYQQLSHHHMQIFAVVVDKRHLHNYIDAAKMHRKAWELLLERIEKFLREEHPKHQGVLIADDISKERNRSLAMKHAYIQSEGTSNGTWLTHIAEMPLFVRSELSNGIQLSDLVAYNIYRCFKYEEESYPFFQRILPHFWCSGKTADGVMDGLWIFPGSSPLRTLRDRVGKKRASHKLAGS